MTIGDRQECATVEDGAAMIARWEEGGFDPNIDSPAVVARVCSVLGISGADLRDIGMPEAYAAAVDAAQ